MKRFQKPATGELTVTLLGNPLFVGLCRRLLTLSNAVQSRSEADSTDSVDDSTERYEDAWPD
ncbi:MAG: hypothetical protein VXZ55_07000 [Planctomycetota bacterium]|nr:hypothetical protein [Planctomycetota bacterium]